MESRSGASKCSKKLAGKAAAATGGMNFARAIFQKAVSTKSCRHQARQRSIVRLGAPSHSVSWPARRSVRPERKALANTTMAAR